MITIINTGVANIRSLQATFDRLRVEWRFSIDPNEIAEGEQVVLPGVGAFAAAMQTLNQLGLCQSIKDRIAADRPMLCICLGLQLLAESSEESPGVKGLGILPHSIKRFPNEVQVPQLGWNEVKPVRTNSMFAGKPNRAFHGSDSCFPFETGEAYFANSFRLLEVPADWGYAETNYGGDFISSCWRGRLLACQFHPELSGPWGEALIRKWLKNQEPEARN
jgi:imidazole glycerol phosphate synthase glutamine amidotransferase subunit